MTTSEQVLERLKIDLEIFGKCTLEEYVEYLIEMLGEEE